MKVAFFDTNEEDKTGAPLDDDSVEKMAEAVKYAIKRANDRDTDVKCVFVLCDSFHLSKEGSQQIAQEIAESGASIKVSMKERSASARCGWSSPRQH